MSGIRSITRHPVVRGYATSGSAPIYVDVDDNALKIIPAGSGTTELAVNLAATASGFRTAVGSGALVSGSLVVATGLTSVLGFTALNSVIPTGATGNLVPQILVANSITTGAVTVTAYSVSSVSGALVAATGSSGSFYWIGFGT